jgi:hypothetical protein
MVETAVADVIGPAVAADTPDRLFDQVVSEREELLCRLLRCNLECLLQLRYRLRLASISV